MNIRIAILAATFAAAPLTGGAVENTQYYWEMCDASAGVALDARHFVVADDEGSTLRIYQRGVLDPVREDSVGKFLTGKKNPETDLEGAARIGQRIYWVTSHGRTRDGEVDPNRQKLFATQIVGNKGIELEPVGKPYTSLLADVFADPRFERFGLKSAAAISAKDRGGLNIEGMCARADGALLIGFRSPVPGGKGLLLPLLNPSEVIEGARARFGEMIELNLAGFGVRDIATVGDKFLIIAGSPDGAKIFRLFAWDGKSAPQLLPGERFEKLNPEAIFRFPDDPEGLFQVFSDDGGKKVNGKECKDLPKKERRFRAVELQITLP